MPEGAMLNNESCTNDGHNMHLRFLISEGFRYKSKEAYKAIFQDTQYRCKIVAAP